MDGIESLFGDFMATAELAALVGAKPTPQRPAWAGPARTGHGPKPRDRDCAALVDALFGKACYPLRCGAWVHVKKSCTCRRPIRYR